MAYSASAKTIRPINLFLTCLMLFVSAVATTNDAKAVEPFGSSAEAAPVRGIAESIDVAERKVFLGKLFKRNRTRTQARSQNTRSRNTRFGTSSSNTKPPLYAPSTAPTYGPIGPLTRIKTKHRLHIRVNLSDQRMYVYHRGRLKNVWAISGGTEEYPTPTGVFGVERMYPRFIAVNWNDAKMPNSVFFFQDFAIHGTDKIDKLGRPASHGCVRLHPTNAALLYKMIEKLGYKRTLIEVQS